MDLYFFLIDVDVVDVDVVAGVVSEPAGQVAQDGAAAVDADATTATTARDAAATTTAATTTADSTGIPIHQSILNLLI